jgi:hypothetical protein
MTFVIHSPWQEEFPKSHGIKLKLLTAAKKVLQCTFGFVLLSINELLVGTQGKLEAIL